MKKLVIVLGKVVHVKEKETKSGKKFYVYQIESEGDNGKNLGNIQSWDKRDYKINDDIRAICFENNRIWKEKIYQDIIILSPEKEKAEMARLGLIAPQQKMKV